MAGNPVPAAAAKGQDAGTAMAPGRNSMRLLIDLPLPADAVPGTAAPPGLTPPSLATLSDARLLRTLVWWQELPRDDGAALPDRRAIEPAAIKDLLPYAILWDVLPAADGGGLRYRCRLAGTMLVEVAGRDCTGQMLPELYGAQAAEMRHQFDRVIEAAQPLAAAHRMAWAGKDFYRYRRILLPFTHHARLQPGDDPDRVALLFNVVSFIPD